MNILLRYPSRSQTDSDLTGRQVFRDDFLQCLHIDGKLRVCLCRYPCGGQLFPHIAGKIFVCGHIAGRLGIRHFEDDAPQVPDEFLLRSARELFHIGKVNMGFLPDREGKGFTGSLHGHHLTVGLDRPFRKHVGFPFEIPLVIQYLKGA